MDVLLVSIIVIIIEDIFLLKVTWHCKTEILFAGIVWKHANIFYIESVI